MKKILNKRANNMPYIKKEKRPVFDRVVDEMVSTGVKVDGDLNFILFKFCKYHVKPSYNNYKNYIGELRQCATEIERRLLAPYEDTKINDPESGEV